MVRLLGGTGGGLMPATDPEGGLNVWNRLEQRELNRLARRMTAGPGELPAPDRPAGTDLLPQIKHIVVLMMENHSYDNYLGMLGGRGDGFPLGPDGQPELSNTGAEGESVPAHHLMSTVQVPDSPSQSWHATHLQWDERQAGRVRQRHPADHAGPGRHGRHGLLDRARPALLLRPGPHIPAGRPVVLVLPGADVPEPPVPHLRDGQRADRRPAGQPGRLPGQRDHLRRADQARHLVGELPPGSRAAGPGYGRALQHRHQGPAAQAAHAAPGGSRLADRAAEGHPVHRGHLPAGHRPVHAARAQHG